MPLVRPATLTGIVTVLVERVSASSRPREGVPADVVFDVPNDCDVTVHESAGRVTVEVARRHGRPESREVLAVSLQGAEIAADGPEALVYAGVEFARGDARTVTVTLVRG